MNTLFKLFRRFALEEKGTAVVEAVIFLPLMGWAYIGAFAYWDVYRSINTVQKASYTVADMLSRQQGPVNDDFIDGMRTTIDYILGGRTTAKIRVTSYRWSEANNRYEVIFSRSPDEAMPELTDANLANLTDRLPIMKDGDSAVLLETEVGYTPLSSFMLKPAKIREFIVTRPRFVPKICLQGEDC
ncbi:TadE/TadG family type IV pilus assembly protein [Pseudorhodobacter sp.]|uniref:TadE/TadG family type IV pilus assembly protein n=1 Tax=Pseudorhodobacter sp. TaxID=1934400 RepID=UPI002649D73D|nr:pilus assembly protein [Pseudorhodobacter sp.]MDN5788765.1 pilus assembly protein [Pseudorhodobacter sp.]